MNSNLKIGIDSTIITESIYCLQFNFIKELVAKNASIILHSEHSEDDIIDKLSTESDIRFISPESLEGSVDILIKDRKSAYGDIPKNLVIYIFHTILEDIPVEEFLEEAQTLNPHFILSDILPDELPPFKNNKLKEFYRKKFFYHPSHINNSTDTYKKEENNKSLIIYGTLTSREEILVNSITDQTQTDSIEIGNLKSKATNDLIDYLNAYSKVFILSSSYMDNALLSTLLNNLNIRHNFYISNLSPVRILWNGCIDLEETLSLEKKSFRYSAMSISTWISKSNDENITDKTESMPDLDSTLEIFEENSLQHHIELNAEGQNAINTPPANSIKFENHYIHKILHLLYYPQEEVYKCFSLFTKSYPGKSTANMSSSWINNEEASRMLICFNEVAEQVTDGEFLKLIESTNTILGNTRGFIFSRLLYFTKPNLFHEIILNEDSNELPEFHYRLIQKDIAKGDAMHDSVGILYNHYITSGKETQSLELLNTVSSNKLLQFITPLLLYLRIINQAPNIDSSLIKRIDVNLYTIRIERLLCITFIYLFYGMNEEGENAFAVFSKRNPNSAEFPGGINRLLNQFLLISMILKTTNQEQIASKYLDRANLAYPEFEEKYNQIFNHIPVNDQLSVDTSSLQIPS